MYFFTYIYGYLFTISIIYFTYVIIYLLYLYILIIRSYHLINQILLCLLIYY